MACYAFELDESIPPPLHRVCIDEASDAPETATALSRPPHWSLCVCEVLSKNETQDSLRTEDHWGLPLLDYNHKIRGHLVPLTPGDPEYDEVASRFGSTVVHSVHRVQNERRYKRYMSRKMEMMEDAGGPVMENAALFHTPRSDVVGKINSYGLDLRHSRVGLFGRGIYLSNSLAKCNSYWKEPEIQGLRYIMCCRALLGKQFMVQGGTKNPSLCAPPPTYDSVCGNVTGHAEFVLYDNDQVYVEYLVAYRI